MDKISQINIISAFFYLFVSYCKIFSSTTRTQEFSNNLLVSFRLGNSIYCFKTFHLGKLR